MEIVPAERDDTSVEALVEVWRVLVMDVGPVLVTDAATRGRGSPGKADRSPWEVSEGEEVGQTEVIMADRGKSVEKSLEAFRPT